MKEWKTYLGGLIALGLVVFLMTYTSAPSSVPFEGYEGQSQPVRLTGVYTCLPHRDTSGPQTLECALGLQATDGEYYALDFSMYSEEPPNVQTGATISANGIFTPIEALSMDYWWKYDIKGIFSINSFETLE